MTRSRVMVIGLDGLEIEYAEQLMAAGEMPALDDLRRHAARFRLDHGTAQRTGLAWEHVASGLSPEAGRRWAAVEFDPATYAAWQEGARFIPWWVGLDKRVVVFDTPYVDLRRAPHTRGIVGWGAHDAGTVTAGAPIGLWTEFEQRFGPYPASKWLYATPWPSPVRTQAMGEALAQALGVRARAARWLASARLKDWELFIAVSGEVHSAVEGLWHGLDSSTPLHGHPSAPLAARAMLDVHRALDAMVAELVATAGDAAIVAFAMGGMGPNHSDIPSMVLLPELLYRDAFGHGLLTVPAEWAAAPCTVPILDETDDWNQANNAWLPWPARGSEASSPGLLVSLARNLPRPVRGLLKGIRAGVTEWSWHGAPPPRWGVTWQPIMCYHPHWPRMPAFALPSFYDGRIRINLEGRERQGTVKQSRYEETCARLQTLLWQCRNPRTGEPAVDSIERIETGNPLAMTRSQADLVVIWREGVFALEHPRLGLIGPVAPRRTGGHTGQHGVAYVKAPGLEATDRGVRSAFDVVPTLVSLLGKQPSGRLSGSPLL
jgi:hypothetical protein